MVRDRHRFRWSPAGDHLSPPGGGVADTAAAVRRVRREDIFDAFTCLCLVQVLCMQSADRLLRLQLLVWQPTPIQLALVESAHAPKSSSLVAAALLRSARDREVTD